MTNTVKINMLIDKKSFITKKIVFIRQRKALPATIYLSQNKVWHINTYHLPNIVFVNKKIPINWQTQYLSAKEKWIIWQAKYLLSINKKKSMKGVKIYVCLLVTRACFSRGIRRLSHSVKGRMDHRSPRCSTPAKHALVDGPETPAKAEN